MRFLGIGDYHSLGDMYWRLGQAGHEVRVYVKEAEAHNIYAGLNTRVKSWKDQLKWLREAGPGNGVILFESTGQGELQDSLRKDGYTVIGSSAWGDRLENERAFAQQLMAAHGLPIAGSWEFTGYGAALDFLAKHPARYVYKVSDGVSASTRNYVGQLADGSDVAALLAMERARVKQGEEAQSHFILMEHLQGVEVGVGAYFDGRQFLGPANLDWEHKRFFPGDVGELTGEMGTLVTYRGAEAIFERTLQRFEPMLREHGYCGYLNLNTIVDERGIHPLEFTSRFGYPGYAILDPLQSAGWADLFARMARQQGGSFPTRDGYALGVVLTVPPFPYEYGYEQLSKGAPIRFRHDFTAQDRQHLHHGEVALDPRTGELVTDGSIGYITVATGVGASAEAASAAAYALVEKVSIPNLRYRNDIGQKCIRSELATLRGWGLLP